MRVGLGVTVWTRGLLGGYQDGIGIYTQQLWQQFKASGVNAQAIAFGVSDEVKLDRRAPEPLECVAGDYRNQVARSIITGMPFRHVSGIRDKIDVFHSPDHHIPKLRHVPVVATIMDAIPIIHPEWVSMRLARIKNAAFRRSSRWAQHIITISEYSKRDIVEAFGVNEDLVSVIPLGYDESFLKRFDQTQRQDVLGRYGLKEGFFVFVGTLQPRKNVKSLILAHRLLPDEIKARHPLVIIGRYGWGDDGVIDEIRYMEKRGEGVWLRDVTTKDLPVLLQSSVSLVFPSLYEGFGLPVLEAFASGIPVITSNSSSIPEVAGDAALFLDDPLNVDEITFNMQRIIEKPDLAESCVSLGYERLSNYSWRQCAEKTLSVYNSLIC